MAKSHRISFMIRSPAFVNPRVVKLYRQAGIRDIAVYLSGCDIIMPLERDDDLYDRMKAQVAADEIHAALQNALAVPPDRTHPGGTYRQIFRLTADDPPPPP